MGLSNQLKYQVLAARHLYGVFLQKIATWMNGKTEGLSFMAAKGMLRKYCGPKMVLPWN